MLNIEPEHPIYRPLWVRVLLLLVLAGWAAAELTRGSPFWGTIAAGLALFVIYELFWRFPMHRANAAAKADAKKASEGKAEAETTEV
jgi:hypothetical protein